MSGDDKRQGSHTEELQQVPTEPESGMKVVNSAHEHIEGNALLVDNGGHIRRLPIPSQDPNDPLNYTSLEKAAIIVCCCWFCKSLPNAPPPSLCLSS